jgi:hypothetical protein
VATWKRKGKKVVVVVQSPKPEYVFEWLGHNEHLILLNDEESWWSSMPSDLRKAV